MAARLIDTSGLKYSGSLISALASRVPHCFDDLEKIAAAVRLDIKEASNGSTQNQSKQSSSSSSGGVARVSGNLSNKGSGICSFPAVSCKAPRGKFDIEFWDDHMILWKGDDGYNIPFTNIHRVLSVPVEDRYKKNPTFVYIMQLTVPLAFRKQKIKFIFMQLKLQGKLVKKGWLPVDVVTTRASKNNLLQAEGLSGQILPKLFEKVLVTLVCSFISEKLCKPNKTVYRSSVDDVSIKCYSGVNDGLLFPLPEGFLFIDKPIQFAPLCDIEGVQFGRGGAGSTRTVDLLIALKNGESMEYRMIEREEQPGLGRYGQFLAKMREKSEEKDASSKTVSGKEDKNDEDTCDDEDGNGDDDSDDGEEDSDFDESAARNSQSSNDDDESSCDDEEELHSTRKRKRTGSVADGPTAARGRRRQKRDSYEFKTLSDCDDDEIKIELSAEEDTSEEEEEEEEEKVKVKPEPQTTNNNDDVAKEQVKPTTNHAPVAESLSKKGKEKGNGQQKQSLLLSSWLKKV